MKKLLLLFASATIVLTSCKKDNDDDPDNDPPTTVMEKIIGEWTGDEQEMHLVIPGVIDTIELDDISYLTANFQADGLLIADSSGVALDTSDWVLLNDNMMTIDGDTFDINTITTSNFNFGFSILQYGGTSTMEIKLVK